MATPWLSSLLVFSLVVCLVSCQYGHYPTHRAKAVVSPVPTDYEPFFSYNGHTGTGGFPYSRPTTSYAPPAPSPSANTCSYWLENIEHRGIAPYASSASYQVFRNVKDFGAKGDGLTDDTAAINLAISSGGRCAPGSCQSTTTTPALVYFPSGTYLINSSIIDYYYTQLIGNPNCLPTLKATANFTGLGLIDGDRYGANGLSYGATNVFWRQVRNFIIDMTSIPYNASATGIHWPTAQATSLQNIVFLMSDSNGTQHQGILVENGSGGFMTDLVFYGGRIGANFGNQQFTTRNLTFYNSVTAINQLYDWGWTYYGISINNCSVGLNMSNGGTQGQAVGSITFFDSSITDTRIGIITAHSDTSLPPTAGSLIVENVALNNVPVAIQGPNGVVLPGTAGQSTIAAWGEGHAYIPNGPNNFTGPIAPNARPASLLNGNNFYVRSKPQYENIAVSDFLSVRSAGAKGDGLTDDTAALQQAIRQAAYAEKYVYFDAGDYKVTSTLHIPTGSKIVGETYPVILGSGDFFSDMGSPQPVVQVGYPGEVGVVEWSDMIVSTQGATEGAILIEWNLAGVSAASPSGMWDVHTRIGGFAGSNLQLAECPTTPDVATPPAPINTNCIAAFLAMHITPSASNLYLENVWLWTADHDVEDANVTQITVYAGRGLLIESKVGTIWLVGTAVEHHTLYQYQLANTKDLFMGQIQTETAYYQPNPPATIPFPPVSSLYDPIFAGLCQNSTGFNFTNTTGATNNCDGYGLRILNSEGVLIYGAGLYSFFDNYNTSCSAAGNGEGCQSNIFSIDGTFIRNLDVYNLNTIGSQNMITRSGLAVAKYSDNVNVFPDTIALFRSE